LPSTIASIPESLRVTHNHVKKTRWWHKCANRDAGVVALRAPQLCPELEMLPDLSELNPADRAIAVLVVPAEDLQRLLDVIRVDLVAT